MIPQTIKVKKAIDELNDLFDTLELKSCDTCNSHKSCRMLKFMNALAKQNNVPKYDDRFDCRFWEAGE